MANYNWMTAYKSHRLFTTMSICISCWGCVNVKRSEKWKEKKKRKGEGGQMQQVMS